MVNPLGHCFWILFGTRFRIPLRGSFSLRGIGFRIPSKILSGFCVTPGLLVPEFLPMYSGYGGGIAGGAPPDAAQGRS